MILRPPTFTPTYTLFPYTTLCRSRQPLAHAGQAVAGVRILGAPAVVARLQADRIAVPGVAQPQDLRLRVPHRAGDDLLGAARSEEHTSELQSLMRISYAVFCLKKKKNSKHTTRRTQFT